MEPPGRSPFSCTTTSAPSSRARTAAASPAIPAPATTRSGTARLDEAERRLVLDVLDLHALGPPDEHGLRVGRVHNVGDLEPARLGLLELVVGRWHEHGEVV